MALIKHRARSTNPWRELDLLTNRMSQFFDDGSIAERGFGGRWVPAVNVEEQEDSILLTAELPGMTEEDIEVNIENNVLTIAGEKSSEREESEGRFHLVERSFGSFRRSFALPRAVDSENVSAEVANGVVTISIPKAPEARSRKVSVKRKA